MAVGGNSSENYSLVLNAEVRVRNTYRPEVALFHLVLHFHDFIYSVLVVSVVGSIVVKSCSSTTTRFYIRSISGSTRAKITRITYRSVTTIDETTTIQEYVDQSWYRALNTPNNILSFFRLTTIPRSKPKHHILLHAEPI